MLANQTIFCGGCGVDFHCFSYFGTQVPRHKYASYTTTIAEEVGNIIPLQFSQMDFGIPFAA